MTAASEALTWATAGQPVLPIAARGKVRLAGTPTTAHGVVRRWWRQWPDAGLAFACGPPSDLVVLDVDGPDGPDSIEHLERIHGPLPPTRTVRTYRGGMHFHFHHPAPLPTILGGQLAPGLDLIGTGGCVVVPPSYGLGPTPYTWLDRGDPAPLPDWLVTAWLATSPTR